MGGGEIGELTDLLMSMRRARDDWESQKKAVKVAERRKEEEKKRIGQALVNAATKRKTASDSSKGVLDVVSDDEGSSLDGVGGRGRKIKRNRQSASSFGGREMERFGEHMKEADLARANVDRERLAFEQERSVADRIEREKERDERRDERADERRERREERIEQQKVELQKFKAMIDAYNRNK